MKKSVMMAVRMHKWRAEERGRVLAELERLREKLVLAAKQIEAEISDQGRGRNDNPFNDGFTEAMNQRRERIVRSLTDVDSQVDQARKDVAEAFEELKKYEAAIANRERMRQQKRAPGHSVEVGTVIPLRQRGHGDD